MWKLDLDSLFTSSTNLYPLKKNGRRRLRNGGKGDQHTATRYYYPDIPEDILIDVLSRLSLKPLARFKCVSKRWKELISNSITVINQPKLLICSKLGKTHSLFHSLDHEANVKRVEVFRIRAPFLHSSCYGLLLIQVHLHLFVWDPLTKFFRKVLTRFSYWSATLVDLCFDYASNEYKVVLVKPSYDSPRDNYFDVFTCGTGIRKSVSVPDWVCTVKSGPFFRGRIHWICKGRYEGRRSYYAEYSYDITNHIVYFDPSTNKLVEIPSLQPKNDVRHSFVGLGVLDRCLCMTRRYERESNIELVVMKEYGNGESWDVMFSISDAPYFRYCKTVAPLFVTKKGEILVFVNISTEKRGIRAYDVYGNFLREILIPHSDDKSFSNVILYEESWFSPTSYNWEQFPPKSQKIWNYLDIFEDNFGFDAEDLDWEENIYFTLPDIETSLEEELLLPRKKKKTKKMEKKFRHDKYKPGRIPKEDFVAVL